MCEVSICIPCYEMKGNGVVYLNELMNSITAQTFKDYEIIITDHSQNDNIEQYLRQKYSGSGIKIKYTRHNYKRGNSSANVNMAIKQAKGKWIKPMFQDDVFYSSLSLEKIVRESYLSECGWSGCGFNHISSTNQIYPGPKHKPQIPIMHENLLVGKNTFGCPSILFFKNDDNLFDEELIWLMDCDFIYSLYKKYGNPTIIKDYLVSVRIWESSVSSQVRNDETITKKEHDYVLEKYPNFVPIPDEEEDE